MVGHSYKLRVFLAIKLGGFTSSCSKHLQIGTSIQYLVA
jgi:hypothetical protein